MTNAAEIRRTPVSYNFQEYLHFFPRCLTKKSMRNGYRCLIRKTIRNKCKFTTKRESWVGLPNIRMRGAMISS